MTLLHVYDHFQVSQNHKQSKEGWMNDIAGFEQNRTEQNISLVSNICITCISTNKVYQLG